MSTERYDVLTIDEKKNERTGETKTYFTKVGVMFPLKDGKPGFSLLLNAGIAVHGKMLIKPPMEKNQGGNDDRPY